LVQIFERDVAWLAEGQRAEVASEPHSDAWVTGKLTAIDMASGAPGCAEGRIELDEPLPRLRARMPVWVQIKVPMADIEPFRSMPREAPADGPQRLREVFVCIEHANILKTAAGKCPLDKNELTRKSLDENQRIDWWCPMHPKVTSELPGGECAECEGMKLLPRVVTFTPAGSVLAVPETAVIDTGTRKVVYVEQGAGMFEGREVVLGPRCGDFFPVIKGVQAGQRVATSGSFLIDAETKLNPGAAVSYFGAGSSTPSP
jgi:Cu(I)/Ag(I) efflux system membrane fusion protein